MQYQGEEVKIAVLIGTFFIFFFSVTIVLLIVVFNKKKELSKKEKEITNASLQQTILQSQLEIQERTFTIISQEIHDNVGQILSLAKVQLNIIEESDNADKSLLTDARENISKAMTDLRDIAKGLNSERIRVVGLVSSIEQEIQRINRVGIVHISLRVNGTDRKIDGQKQLILFRVIQECLQNIIKHAAASSVTITLAHQLEQLIITVKDDGKGFNFQQEQIANQGLGLQNIFKRVALMGGKVEINSVLHEGTTVKLYTPYE